MILNKLSVKFQFAYKNTPSFFRWGVLFAIIVCFSGGGNQTSLRSVANLLRKNCPSPTGGLFALYNFLIIGPSGTPVPTK